MAAEGVQQEQGKPSTEGLATAGTSDPNRKDCDAISIGIAVNVTDQVVHDAFRWLSFCRRRGAFSRSPTP
jgi:hypothetical protein